MSDWFRTHEIRSWARPEIIYACEGDEIRVIKEEGNVIFCEKRNGEKFPVAKQDLEVPAEKIEKTPVRKKGKTTSVIKVEQPSMFL